MNIYLSPEALKAAEVALGGKSWFDLGARKAAYRALIQYIVENPRELSKADHKEIELARMNFSDGPVFATCIRLAFTPPTPDVPEKIVELIEKHTKGILNHPGFQPDWVGLAIECYEAGMAVSK